MEIFSSNCDTSTSYCIDCNFLLGDDKLWVVDVTVLVQVVAPHHRVHRLLQLQVGEDLALLASVTVLVFYKETGDLGLL